MVRFVDEVTPWRRLKKGVLAGAGSRVVLDEFTVVGPAEIRVRSDEEEFSLHYPVCFRQSNYLFPSLFKRKILTVVYRTIFSLVNFLKEFLNPCQVYGMNS